MSKREQLKLIKKRKKKEKITRNLYASSTILFLLTIIVNIINIFYSPYLLNGLILEINIAIIIYCIYSWIKSQKSISNLNEEELNIKIRESVKNFV